MAPSIPENLKEINLQAGGDLHRRTAAAESVNGRKWTPSVTG